MTESDAVVTSAAPAQAGKRPAKSRWRQRGVPWAEALAVAVGAVLVTRVLLELSGNALWLPREQRVAIHVFVPLFGLALYTLARITSRGVQEWIRLLSVGRSKGRVRQTLSERGQAIGRFAAVMLAVLMFGAALFTFTRYMDLRYQCIHSIQPKEDWWILSFGEPSRLPLPPPDRSDARAMAAYVEAREHHLRTFVDPKVPHVFDRASAQLFLPARWPSTMREKIELAGGGDFYKGLNDYKSQDLLSLYEWLDTEGRPYLRETGELFFWTHVTIIAFTAFGVGLMFVPIQSLLKETVGAIL